jgi:hypothetical protein
MRLVGIVLGSAPEPLSSDTFQETEITLQRTSDEFGNESTEPGRTTLRVSAYDYVLLCGNDLRSS